MSASMGKRPQPSFLGKVLSRTGAPRKLKDREPKKKRRTAYISANGAPGEESGAIGTAGSSGSGAGGGS